MWKNLLITALLLAAFAFTVNSKTIQVVSFNDFHGQMTEDGSNPGMAKFAAAVKKQIAQYPDSSILVSAGDNYQGSALAVLTYGAPVNDMMKELGVKASAVGNHEFDWTVEQIEKWASTDDFPYIASNIEVKETGKPVTWAKPYIIVKCDGAKIAFIGATTQETAYTTKPINVKHITFTDPVKSIQKWVDFLKAGRAPEGKPDVIIGLVHIDSYQDKDGKVTGNCVDICEKVKGLDALITGHSHELVSGTVNKVPVIQAYKYGRALGILDIELNADNQLEKITPSTVSVTAQIKTLKPDAQAEAIYEKYEGQMKKIDRIIGNAPEELYHAKNAKGVTPLGQIVTKIMADETGSQIGLTNGGGLRCEIPKGSITVSKMYELMPFDNMVTTLELSGADLKKAVEHGLYNPNKDTGDAQFYGLKVYYDSNAPYMSRIKSMTLLDGTPIEPDKYYKIATIDFLVMGGDQYDFSKAKDVKNTNIPLRDMLIDAIEKIKTITPEPIKSEIDTSKEDQQEAA